MPAERPFEPRPSSPQGALTGWMRWAYLPLLVSFAAAVFIVFILDSDLNEDPRTRVSAVLEGTTPRPFAYRALLPLLTRATIAALPGEAEESLAGWVPAPAPDRKPGVRIEAGAEAETVVLFGWIGVFLLVFALSFEPLFRAATGLETAWTGLAPFVALAGLPPFFFRAYYYDLPVLALSTLCLLWMVRKRWTAYLIGLVLACINKETAVLFPLLFALYYFPGDRMERPRYWRLLAAQAGVVLAVRGVLMAAFAGRPGGAVEFHLFDMLALNFRAYHLETGLAWSVVALAVAYDWKYKPPFLKAGLAMLLPLYAAYLAFGVPREIRVFYEVYPVVCAMALFPFLRRMG